MERAPLLGLNDVFLSRVFVFWQDQSGAAVRHGFGFEVLRVDLEFVDWQVYLLTVVQDDFVVPSGLVPSLSMIILRLITPWTASLEPT